MELPTEPPVPAINVDRLAWRKNVPYLYTRLLTLSIPWPSLTVQWFPEVKTVDKSQELLLGTRTAGAGPEYVRFGRLELPRQSASNLSTYDYESGEFATFQPSARVDLDIFQKIDHSGEIHRARYMPQNPSMIGSISSTGQVLIFDRTKFPSAPCGNVVPSISLEGHSDEGFGLCWSPLQEGLLATGANDSKVFIWDITRYSGSHDPMSPAYSLTYHTAPVNDVKWHPHDPQLMSSCGDDNKVLLCDWRSPKLAQSTDLLQPVFSVAFNPSNEYLLAAGCKDGKIKLIDIRNGAIIHTLFSESPHTDSVNALEWNTRHTAILASGSSDNTVAIWDTSKISESKEHKFVHAGHTAPVADISWNPAYDLVLASVAEDNGLHVWEPVWE